MSITLEPGSFRDKANRVFYRGNQVYRTLSYQAMENMVQLISTTFFPDFVKRGKIIPTRIAPYEQVPGLTRSSWAVMLHHDRIPFVSYPYEWTFSMLKDAALLQLELLCAALAEGMILKDASSFNIQWVGSRPVFIDIPSFVPWRPGEPWVAYRQFCQLFLFPLLLQAHRDVAFQPWLRGSIDGISADDCSRLLSRDFYKPGVLADVLIHAWAQKSYDKTTRKISKDLQQAGFHKELILANLQRLTKIIKKLQWTEKSSVWSGYSKECNYSHKDYQAKLAFVERIARRKPRHEVWDLGCNSGDFSKAVAPHADYVVSVDGDARVVDWLYQKLRHSGPQNILPLTINLSDPSPGLGWLGQERKSFVDRGQPDLILCLALFHHINITANIPMNQWIFWLAQLKSDLIIEFVTDEDEMVQGLLRNKEGNHEDYDKDLFEAILGEAFHIRERVVLSSKKRILYSCEVKK